MLIVKEEGEIDIQDCYEWYESKKDRLGLRFLEELDSIFLRIEECPEIFPIKLGNVRRALGRKFPCAVYFEKVEGKIFVFAVLHQRRNPKVWRRRI